MRRLWHVSKFERVLDYLPDRPGQSIGYVATCEQHGVTPEADLADVLLRIQDHPKERLVELLPHRWKETIGSGFTVERIVTPADAT